jgi:hypothetical protein
MKILLFGMRQKALLIVSGAILALLAFGSVAFAAGIGPSVADIRSFIKGPEQLPMISQSVGCDTSGTSTNCATIKTSRPAEQAAASLSTATSYTEVAQTQQSGKIDDRLTVNNALKTISFCGDLTLKTRQIIINSVDVGQRIAQLASNDQMGKLPNGDSLGQGMCNSMPHNIAYIGGILQIPDVTTGKTADSRASGDNYFVFLGTEAFAINPDTNEIFSISAYDGSTLTSVGKLK